MKTFEQFNNTKILFEIRFNFYDKINNSYGFGLFYFYKNECVDSVKIKLKKEFDDHIKENKEDIEYNKFLDELKKVISDEPSNVFAVFEKFEEKELKKFDKF